MKYSLLKFSIIMIVLFTGKNIFSQSAEQTLKNISKDMSNQSKIYLEFEYALSNKAANLNQKIFGKLCLKENKYHLNFMQNTIINDGEKIYNINQEDKEINIINQESIQQEDDVFLNPKKFLKIYKNQYFYSWYKNNDNRLKKYKYIQALPKKKEGDIAYILIGIDTQKKFVMHLINVDKDDTQTILEVKNIKTKIEFNAKKFVFDKQFYEKQDYFINE